MKNFSFSDRSLEELNTCHEDLILIAKESISISDIDFGISEGNRSTERQAELYRKGLSKIDGVNVLGKHNYYPSKAFDVFVYVPNKPKLSYDYNHLCYVGGVITSTANRLYKEGKITHLVRWGANWDKDQEIISDQTFQDLPHFELYKPE